MVQKIEIEKIINLAKNFYKKNNLPEAKKLYKKILEIDSNHLESIFGLGVSSHDSALLVRISTSRSAVRY